jgi:hypothetical protein
MTAMRLIAVLAALALPAAAHAEQLPPAAPAGQVVFYGHIKSLKRIGDHYVLRLDPAWPLGGVTAHEAAIADLPRGVPPLGGFYGRDESHALLTFRVPRWARATVITTRPPKGVRSKAVSTRVSVAELAQLVRGRNPHHRRLLASPSAFGYWIRVAVDQARSLEAQYRP